MGAAQAYLSSTSSYYGGCPNVESFPEKMLPASLTNLTILSFPNLKYMSSLQSLTSLEELDMESVKISHPFQRMACLPHSSNFVSPTVLC
jgi:hypothetical protein